jgi:hypothetical protein
MRPDYISITSLIPDQNTSLIQDEINRPSLIRAIYPAPQVQTTICVKTARQRLTLGKRFISFLSILLLIPALQMQAQYVAEVVSYEPGTGYSTEFGTGLGFTLTESVLGQPNRETPGTFGGPVDPFSPPYLREQILSIGTGGSLTVRLDQPAFNDPLNPYGIDFLIFGAAGFIIVNGDFTGGGITDGSLFGGNEATTQVSVSEDGLLFFLLNPDRAPNVESLFPTDGLGQFTRPVDPSLEADDFDGLGLEAIRALYLGSGGGTGYDLDWAIDGEGKRVELSSIQYVRVDVFSGKVEIDGISVVEAIPEPGTLTLTTLGSLFFWLNSFRRRHNRSHLEV